MMKADELKAYHIRKTQEWRAANPERKKEIDAKAHKKYIQKKRETDPEFMERLRASNRKSTHNLYVKKRAAMTEEELEEYRRKTRERVAKIRARKKAEKLALEAMKNKEGESNEKV